MLASINPLGERARGTRWWWTTTWYFAGSVAGGAAIGGLAGGIGAVATGGDGLSAGVAAVVVAVGAAIGLALDLGLGGLHLPTIRRQVDEDWLVRYRGWLYGSGFGFQLGLGVVTVVTTSTVYLMLVLAGLTADLGSGLLIGGIFGLVRATPLLTVARADHPERLRAVLRDAARVEPAARIVAVTCVSALVVLGTVGAVA